MTTVAPDSCPVDDVPATEGAWVVKTSRIITDHFLTMVLQVSLRKATFSGAFSPIGRV